MTATEAPQMQQTQQPQQPQGLPPTGLQQQIAGIQQTYQSYAGQGIDIRRGATGYANQNQAMPSTLQTTQGGNQTPRGQTSLNQLATTLARSYGLSLGRGDLVDDQGNFLMTPDQVAAASGGRDTMGTAAAKMNYIAEAMQREQQRRMTSKSEASLQTGLGLVQSRGRGSLAAMQSGMYESLANLYQNQQYEAADFSYFIQKEQLDLQQQVLSRAERLMKKQARGQFVTGLGMTAIGLFTGNYALAAGGAAQAGGSAGNTGWF